MLQLIIRYSNRNDLGGYVSAKVVVMVCDNGDRCSTDSFMRVYPTNK